MRVQDIVRNACPICGKEMRTGQNHVRSTTFGWIDESGIISKFCRQRRAKPSSRPYRVTRAISRKR